jgi:molecular chaperone GrpE
MNSPEKQKPQPQSKPPPQAPEQQSPKAKESDLAKMRGQLEVMIKAYNDEKARSEDLAVRLKYMQSDYENLRRRTDKQLDDMRRYANEGLLCSLLETVDELELALRTAKHGTSDAIVQGVEMTLKKLKKVMEQEGVTAICALYNEFDPSKHAAVGRVETDELKEGTVVEEVRKGYMLMDKVIRPSMVRVAVKPVAAGKGGCGLGQAAGAVIEAEKDSKLESESNVESGSKSQGVNSHE